MMAMGSSIEEAFGIDNIKMKKRNKKKDKINMINPSRYDTELRNNIQGFDMNFQNSSNSIHSNDDNDYHLLEQQDDFLGEYHPYNIQFNQPQHHHDHTVKQLPPPPPPSNVNVEQPPPPPPVMQINNKQPTFNNSSIRNAPHNSNIQPNINRPKPSTMNRNLIPRNTNSINISQNEYNELLNYRNEINKKQYELSQNLTEGFTNINDDFNDILLFCLLGIFFLIFTDYIYKMGKKSY